MPVLGQKRLTINFFVGLVEASESSKSIDNGSLITAKITSAPATTRSMPQRIKKAIPTIRHSAQPIDDDFDIQFKKNITILCTSSQSFVVHSPSVTTAATFKAIMYTISIYYSVESYGFDVE